MILQAAELANNDNEDINRAVQAIESVYSKSIRLLWIQNRDPSSSQSNSSRSGRQRCGSIRTNRQRQNRSFRLTRT